MLYAAAYYREYNEDLIFFLFDRQNFFNIYRIAFSSECVKPLGLFHSDQVVTSASVSPYIDSECAISLDDGRIYIWNASQQPYASTLKVTMPMVLNFVRKHAARVAENIFLMV